jgi:hypothetical protein
MRIAAVSLLLVSALLVCAAGAQILPPSPRPAPTMGLIPAPEDPTVTKMARAELDAWRSGTLDLTHYAPAAAGYFTADIRQKVKDFLTGLGDVKSFTYLGKATRGDQWAYEYSITGSKAKCKEVIHVGTDGKIDAMLFLPG